MQILINSTTKIVSINGVPARIWEGRSHGGSKVICFITRIAVPDGEPTEEFNNELQQHEPPSADAQSFPLSLII